MPPRPWAQLNYYLLWELFPDLPPTQATVVLEIPLCHPKLRLPSTRQFYSFLVNYSASIFPVSTVGVEGGETPSDFPTTQCLAQ